MVNNHVITLTAWRRPQYLAEVLGALQACEGSEKYKLLLHLEPDSPEVVRVAKRFAAQRPNTEVHVNPRRRGCDKNTMEALEHGFQHSDFVVHIEDDTVPFGDCLWYMEWAAEKYQDDPDIFSVTAAGHTGYPKDSGKLRACDVSRRHWFTGWQFGIWSDRWVEMQAGVNVQTPPSWDAQTTAVRGERQEIFPHVVRVRNIGRELGLNSSPEHWQTYVRTAYWAGDYDVVPADRVPFEEILDWDPNSA